MIRDRAFMRTLLAKAKALGCTALVFTVDMPVPGTRYRDYRSGLAGAAGMLGAMRRMWQAVQRPGWAWDVGVNGRPHSLGNVAPVLGDNSRSEEHTSELQSLMRTSYAVFCLKKKTNK